MSTGQSEIAWVIRSAMLVCLDVLDVECHGGNRRLGEAAVFATFPGATAYQTTRGRVHQS